MKRDSVATNKQRSPRKKLIYVKSASEVPDFRSDDEIAAWYQTHSTVLIQDQLEAIPARGGGKLRARLTSSRSKRSGEPKRRRPSPHAHGLGRPGQQGMNDMAEERRLVFGRPDECNRFEKGHTLFLKRFPDLVAALKIAFCRRGESDKSIDRVVFFLGRLCVEDFMEILLLCANGYDIGGMKILRGMYERAVTAAYLCKHPEYAEDFLEYYWVSNHKLVGAVKQTFGSGVLPEDDRAKELEENFNRVRGRFMVTDCETCGTKRLNHTWSKLDFVSMAKSAPALGKLIVPAYYIPTERAHSTAAAVVKLLRITDNGAISFDSGAQPEMADMALHTAHNVLLQVLWCQQEHFRLGSLDALLQKCFRDLKEVWPDGRDGLQGKVTGA